jgi:hypothetical protein
MANGMIYQTPQQQAAGMPQQNMNQLMAQLGSAARAAQTPASPAAPQQAPLQYGAYSLPTANMSDSALMNWYAQNNGRQIYSKAGQVTQIPGGVTGAGNLRLWMNSQNGILNGASLGQNPGTAQLPDYMRPRSQPQQQNYFASGTGDT